MFALMNLKSVFKRLLPSWTLLNLVLTVMSIVSAIILYLTNTLFPSTRQVLQLTVISFVNALFLFYWTFWILLIGPPIFGALYLSRTEPDYYRFAVQNIAAVVVLFVIKIAFNFDILSMAV
jgi:hypothetical protein